MERQIHLLALAKWYQDQHTAVCLRRNHVEKIWCLHIEDQLLAIADEMIELHGYAIGSHEAQVILDCVFGFYTYDKALDLIGEYRGWKKTL